MKIPFTASARTAMLIGSENFSNPEGAIIELVKIPMMLILLIAIYCLMVQMNK